MTNQKTNNYQTNRQTNHQASNLVVKELAEYLQGFGKKLDDLVAWKVKEEVALLVKQNQIKHYLSTREVATMLRCSRSKVIRWYHAKKLAGAKVDKKIIFDLADVIHFVESRKEYPSGD